MFVYIVLIVWDYDEVIVYYIGIFGFELIDDIFQLEQDKCWVVVKLKGLGVMLILLVCVLDDYQVVYIGDQVGGWVFLFLSIDDFWCDYCYYVVKGVEFMCLFKEVFYGIVVVFKDFYGNLWDLIEFVD